MTEDEISGVRDGQLTEESPPQADTISERLSAVRRFQRFQWQQPVADPTKGILLSRATRGPPDQVR